MFATALLAGCGAPETVAESSAALCAVHPHCDACKIDPSSSSGGSKTCYTCDGDSYTIECKPTCPYHVRNVAGATVPNPWLVAAFWGSWFYAEQDGINASSAHGGTWRRLSGSQAFWSRMSEYGIGVGTYDGGYYTNFGLSADLSDSAIRTELEAETVGSTGGLPRPGPQTLYIIYLPKGVHSTRNGTSSTGYHDSFVASNGTRLYYAVLDGGYDSVSTDLVAAHEVEEMATDAILGQGYNVPNMSEGEIADLCAPAEETIEGVLVPKVWSQQICGCR